MESSGDEIHMRMSKKIAQLTKVIYMLNTKNDEHEYELRGLEETYESEIQDILKSAYEKVKKFQTLIEKKSGNNIDDLKRVIENLKKKNEDEKRRCESQVKEYKIASKKSVESAREKVASLQDQVETAKADFLRKIEEMKDSQSKADVAAIKEAHRKEISELVQKSNQKYRSMLNKRLDAEDQLKDDMKAAKGELAELRARISELEREAEEISTRLVAEFGQKEKELKSDFEEKLRKASGNADALSAENRALQKQIKQLEAQNKDRIAEAQGLTDEVNRLKQRLERAEENSKLQTGELGEKLSALEKKAALLTELNSEQFKRIEDLNTQIAKLQQSEGDLKAKIEEKKRELAEAQAKLSGAAQAHKDEVARLRQDIRTLETQNGEIKSSLRKLKEQHTAQQEKLAKSESAKAALEKRVKDLESAAKESSNEAATRLSAAQKANDTLSQKVSTLEKALKALREEMERKLKELKEAAELKQRKMRDQFEQDLLKRGQEFGAEKAALMEEIAKLKKEMESKSQSTDSLTKKIKELQDVAKRTTQQSELQLRQMQERLEQQKNHARVQHQKDQQSIQKMRMQAEGQKKSFDERLSHLNAKLKAETFSHLKTKKELEAKIKELGHLKGVVESERQRYAEAITDSDNRLKKIRDAHKKDLLLVNKSHLKEIERLKAAFKAKEDGIRRDCEAKIRELEADSASDRKKIASRIVTLEAEISEMTRKHSAALEKLRKQHEEDVSSLNSANEATLQKLRNDLDAKASAAAQQMREEHQRALDALRAEMDGKITALTSQHKRAMEEQREVDQKRLAEALADATATKEQEKKALEGALRDEFKRKMQAEMAAWKKERERIIEERDSESREKEDYIKRLESSEATSADRNERLQRRKLEIEELNKMIESKESLIRETQREWKNLCDKQRKEMHHDHEKQLSRYEEMKLQEMKTLSQNFSKKRAKLETKIEATLTDLDALRERFENRESRAEDVEHIKALQKFAAEQAALRKKAVDDLKFYKLELINREENFNKKFGRSPAISVKQGSSATRKSPGPRRANAQAAGAGSGSSNISTSSSFSSRLRDASPAKSLPPLPNGKDAAAGALPDPAHQAQNASAMRGRWGMPPNSRAKHKSRRMESLERKSRSHRSPSLDVALNKREKSA